MIRSKNIFNLGALLLALLQPPVFAADSLAPAKAAELQAKGQAIIVDVREDSEWQAGHIPGAIHIPLGDLSQRLPELKSLQHGSIITQCRSGKRSAQAQAALKSAGFTDVYNLEGGLQAWQAQGLPTQ